MRKRGRTDANQTDIVKVLRKCGLSVEITSAIGGGFPDIAVGHRGLNWLFEVKDGAKPPSQRRLTKEELDWHAEWSGQVHVVESAEQALKVIFG